MKTDTANRIFSQLKSRRDRWVDVWRELVRYLAPTAGSFDNDVSGRQGQRIDHKTLIDSRAGYSISILSSGMMSGLTSPSRPWFELTLDIEPEKQSNAVKRWLYDVKQIIEQVFAKSNIYNILHNFYEEIAVFGTAAFLVEENYDTVVFGRPMTIGEFMLGENELGKIDRFGREFYMTSWQLVRQFGLDNVPRHVQDEYRKKNYDALHKVRHLITPNVERDPENPDNHNMPFISVYWMDGTDTFLSVSGYNDFPVIAARWEVKRSGDTYGRGPGWQVLGDVKMLQKMQKAKLVALDKLTNPPVMVSESVQGEVNLLPGGITRYNASTDPGIKPVYQVSPDLKDLEYSIE